MKFSSYNELPSSPHHTFTYKFLITGSNYLYLVEVSPFIAAFPFYIAKRLFSWIHFPNNNLTSPKVMICHWMPLDAETDYSHYKNIHMNYCYSVQNILSHYLVWQVFLRIIYCNKDVLRDSTKIQTNICI